MSTPYLRPSKMPKESADFSALIRPWAAKWGLPGLELGIRVRFHPQLQGALGRCQPEKGSISLHVALRNASASDLATVLCHEAAHIAAYHLHGRRINGHQSEWRELVIAADDVAQSAARRDDFDLSSWPGPPVVVKRNRSRRSVLHRCPVCQTTRKARRPVRSWRCAECVAAGLEGRLHITERLDARA